jgi:hypothetical protein
MSADDDAPRMSEYEDGEEPYRTSCHSDGIDVERETLSDGSHAYNVRLTQPDGVRLRFGCINEISAWNFADELAAVSHVTVLEDAQVC